MIRRRGFGLTLVITVLVGLVLAVMLGGQAYFASASTSQVQRMIRAEQARSLAESALEEAFVLVQRDANGAPGGGQDTFGKFRTKQEAGFKLDLDAGRLEALKRELAKQPLYRDPAPSIEAAVRFERPLDLSQNPFHDQRFGTLEISASVSYPLDRTVEKRTVTRWYEFKVVHTTLPFPFDRTLLYLHDARKIVDSNALINDSQPPMANLLLAEAAGVLESTPGAISSLANDLESESAPLADTPAMAPAQAALGTLRGAVGEAEGIATPFQKSLEGLRSNAIGDDPPFLIGFPVNVYALENAAPARLDLNEYNLPVLNKSRAAERDRTEIARADAEGALVTASHSLTQIAAGESGPDVSAAAQDFSGKAQDDSRSASKVLETYHKFEKLFTFRGGEDEVKRFREYLDMLDVNAWTNAASGGPGSDPVLVPGKAQFAIPKESCKDPQVMKSALGRILDEYGPPFQGTIHLDNAGGAPLALDGNTDTRFRAFEGRLTLVTSGDCSLRDVKRGDPNKHLITVVCHGNLTVGGVVQASLVAFKRLLRTGVAPRTTILGHVILDQPAHELATNEEVEQVLQNLELLKDPVQVRTSGDNVVKPDRTSVLFGPVPIHARAPRQEAR